MDYERHLAALRHEGAAFVTAARADLGKPVPSCPDWDVAALARHLGHAFRWAAHIVRTHADAEVTDDDVRAAAVTDPAEAVEESLAELVETLANESPDATCWNWSGQNETAAFWARRMANEAAVHRWDAELAQGAPRPVEPELARDGVAELLTVFLPRHLARVPQDGLRGTFRVEATDTGDVWTGTLYPDHVEPGTGTAPDATVTGAVSDLVLAFWGRDVAVETSGDERILRLLTE